MAVDIIASVVTGGTNNHATVSEEANSFSTDFITQGMVGAITNTGGVSPATGAFAVNANGTPDMTVTVTAGRAYIAGTPSGQSAQVFSARMATNYTGYTINANSSGSTKYDWIYLKFDATTAANPSATANDVITLYTSRSSSNSSDNGTPPTYGIVLAVVTVSNGASSITNGNISDKRVGDTATFTDITARTGLYTDNIYEKTSGNGVSIDSFVIKDGVPKNWDNWVTPDETWTYASASTFTVPGDQTTKYTKGTRLKWTQTTVKYGVVVASSYGAPNTTITIAVNTDYTIANAAISANYYSYADNPQGYPMLFNYTPATTNITLGNGTLSGVFSITGKTVFARAKLVFGSTSAMGTGPTIGLPIAPYGYANFAPVGVAGMRDDSSGSIYFGAMIYDGEPLVYNSAGTYVVHGLLTATVPMTWTTSDSCWFTASYTI